MHVRTSLAIPVCLFAVFIWITGSSGIFIPNLTESCYRCLCYVSTGCDMSHGCTGGYCGPFNISRIYWVEAGKVVLPGDDPERNHAWEDCAKDYYCSKRVIENYLEIFGRSLTSNGYALCAACVGSCRIRSPSESYLICKRKAGTRTWLFSQDCNSDGLTNCFDYMMINGNGGYGCNAPLNRSVNGRRWLKRYEDCRTLLSL